MFEHKEEYQGLYFLVKFFFSNMEIRFYDKRGWGLGTVQNHSPICTAFKLHYNFDKILLEGANGVNS